MDRDVGARRSRGPRASRGRLADDPDDAGALIGLAETADPRDLERLVAALQDRRPRVRAAALTAVGRLDLATAMPVALAALHEGSGRESRAALKVLREVALDATERARLEAVVLDPDRPWPARLRSLGLLHRSRWEHLALLLRLGAEDPAAPLTTELDVWLRRSAHVALGPAPQQRSVIESHLDTLDGERRQRLELILRTTS